MTPPPSSAAASRPATRQPHARRATPPRRMSGPLRPAAATGSGSVALPRPGAVPFPARVGKRLKALPDHRLVTRLLTGRVWIPLLAFLLFGLVTMQVHLLKLNTGISRAVEKSARLERENAAMRASIGSLSSGERQRAVALKNGLVDPAAGSARFLRVRPGDASLAAKRVAKPGDTSALSAPTTAQAQTQTPVTQEAAPTVTQSQAQTPTQTQVPAQTQTQQTQQAAPTQQYQAPQQQTTQQQQTYGQPSTTGAPTATTPTR